MKIGAVGASHELFIISVCCFPAACDFVFICCFVTFIFFFCSVFFELSFDFAF